MRLRRLALPSLLVLGPALAHAQQQPQRQEKPSTLSKEEILALNTVPGAAVGRAKTQQQQQQQPALKDDKPSPPITSSKPYVGTSDAPVDGLDGKPHAGPFVDTLPEMKAAASSAMKDGTAAAAVSSAAKSIPTSLENFANAEDDSGWKVADIPEKNDGVMNDENRVRPKKGTTGTEGGVSEKAKERAAKPEQEKLPLKPEGAKAVVGSEEAEQAVKKEEVAGRKEGEAEKPKKKGAAFGEGGYGMEKPADLPEAPHKLPSPDSKTPRLPPSSDSSSTGPPVEKAEKAWLQDTMPYTEGQKHPPAANKNVPSTPAPLSGATTTTTTTTEWHEYIHSFGLSYTMILFSEIGDKTFLIAALMAMRHARFLVFSAALSALITMTILSAVLGHVVPTLLPKRLTTGAAGLLFLVFGVRMLVEGLAMPADLGVAEEMREVEQEIGEESSLHRGRSTSTSAYNLESGRNVLSPPDSRSASPSKSSSPSSSSGLASLGNLLGLVLSPAWVQTFVMTFLGEWGDRSQIATIAMAAGQDYWWVTLGAVAGHACCTGLAVVGGRAMAGRVGLRVGEYNIFFARVW